MGPLIVVTRDLVQVAADNGYWMTWNLILAVIPAALAVVVFRHRGPRTATWWTGAALCALFLPNAPYVITDLVHLRSDVVRADSDLAVIAGVLPVYAVFVGVGILAYVLAVGEMGRYLTRVGLGRWRGTAEVATHAVCAVGVVLGRVARLNSWEPLTEPHSTAERIVLALAWRGAPLAVLVLFGAIWVSHGATRALVRSAMATVVSAVQSAQRLTGPA
ncbi:MAG: DUF1361 domain-containing protein [Acidimicrobiales bacterium]